MIGVAVISHGTFCEGIVDSVSMVAGKAEQLETVSLKPGQSPQTFQDQLKETLESVDTGMGVLVLVDLLGGTPFNTIGALSKDYHVGIVTGMNMAALISVVLQREEETTLEQMMEIAEKSARDGITTLKR